jgi:hypothetical protein
VASEPADRHFDAVSQNQSVKFCLFIGAESSTSLLSSKAEDHPAAAAGNNSGGDV